MIRRYLVQAWQVARLETQMQIVTHTTPRWHKVLARAEIWLRGFLGAIGLVALVGCQSSGQMPSAEQLVAQGQQGVALAGGVITVAASAACLAQSVAAVGAQAAVDTHNTKDAAALAGVSVAAGRGCNWTNPLPR